MKRPLTLLGVSILALGMLGCDVLRSYPKKIQEFPEPWKALDPGKPRERFPTPRVITEGGGATIAPGDLVQLHIRNKWVNEGTWHERGNWWIWVGFRTQSDTSFFSTEPRVASALLGLQEGGVLEFIEAGDQPGTDSRIAGTLLANVFGDSQYYFWRKGNQGDANIYVTSSGTPSQIEIKRVCKGQTKYRTVRLFDDSPVQVCSGLNCRVTTEAREAWIDEARIDAVCNDGKKVSFQYGPIGSRNGKEGRSPKRGYFDEWLLKAWDKIPRGVRFEGNHAPVIETTPVKTKTGVALAIDFRKFAHDADGDSLTTRIIRAPENGKLIPNPDGSVTYMPNDKYHGIEHVNFGITDGMAETSGVIDIEVAQSAR